jgi:hypothetical protein
MIGLSAGLNLGVGTAGAVLIESFEAVGIPAGWTLSTGGIGGSSAAVTNVAPTEGSRFGFIDTRGTTDTTGLTPGTGETVGTMLTSTGFAVLAGEVLRLDLNFLTNNGSVGFEDFALVRLLDSSTSSVVATLYNAYNRTGNAAAGDPAVPCTFPGNVGCLAEGISAGVTLTPGTAFMSGLATGAIGGPATGTTGGATGVTYGPTNLDGDPAGFTGWVTSSYIPGAGTYKLFFAVTHVGDMTVDTALAIDNIRTEPVPEPGSLLLIGFGMAGLAAWRRRKKA